jgi:HSP20 family protein
VKRPYDLWADMDRMFDDFRTQFDDLFWPVSQRSELLSDIMTRNPPMDIADLGDKYEMHVEMPGIPKNDINIEVTPDSIEIYADHEESKENKDKNWLRRERSSMSYYRSLELPEQIKSDNVDAEFKEGILTVMLPKVEPKPKHKVNKVKIK